MLTEHVNNLKTWYVVTTEKDTKYFFKDIISDGKAAVWTANKTIAHKFLAKRSAEQFIELTCRHLLADKKLTVDIG